MIDYIHVSGTDTGPHLSIALLTRNRTGKVTADRKSIPQRSTVSPSTKALSRNFNIRRRTCFKNNYFILQYKMREIEIIVSIVCPVNFNCYRSYVAGVIYCLYRYSFIPCNGWNYFWKWQAAFQTRVDTFENSNDD